MGSGEVRAFHVCFRLAFLSRPRCLVGENGERRERLHGDLLYIVGWLGPCLGAMGPGFREHGGIIVPDACGKPDEFRDASGFAGESA
jgi:hypothetical protein